jgi:hypothetical protein
MDPLYIAHLRPEWNAAAPTKYASFDRARVKIKGTKTSQHWHWANVYSKSLVELMTPRERGEVFSRVKAYAPSLEFGDEEWQKVVFYVLSQSELPQFAPNWPSFLPIPDDAHDEYKARDFDRLNAQQNIALRRLARDKDRWMDALRVHHKAWQRKLRQIFVLMDSTGLPGSPRYRVSKHIGLRPQQYVFLVKNTVDPSDVKVAKWDRSYEANLYFWRRMRKLLGKSTFWFSTTHQLVQGNDLLLMERLRRLDDTDSAYEVGRALLPQLQRIHRVGIVHSDIKWDNIMKSPADPPKYYLIDFDTMSATKYTENSVQREVYTLPWVSQAPVAGKATSYRYDLEELCFALWEIAKIGEQFLVPRSRNPLDPKLIYRLPVATLMELNLPVAEIIQNAQSEISVYFDKKLREFYRSIMSLPERMPFADIDHTALVESLQQPVTDPVPRDPVQCAKCNSRLCEPFTVHTVDTKGRPVSVCNIKCAALANPSRHHAEALAHHESTRKIRAPPRCFVCGDAANERCRCGVSYCSVTCQSGDWETHQDYCTH